MVRLWRQRSSTEAREYSIREERERERERERETDRQTDRQTETETETEAEAETETERDRDRETDRERDRDRETERAIETIKEKRRGKTKRGEREVGLRQALQSCVSPFIKIFGQAGVPELTSKAGCTPASVPHAPCSATRF